MKIREPYNRAEGSTQVSPDCFRDRLKLAIGDHSIRSIAAKIGLSPSVIHQYLSGKSEPTRKALIAIADGTATSIEWLVIGSGPMKREDPTKLVWGVREPFASTLNVQILQNVLKALDEVLQESRQTITPDKKAKIAGSIYEMFQNLPAETQISKLAVHRLLNLIK